MQTQVISHSEYLVQAARHMYVPMYIEMPADLETPMSIFLKLCAHEPGAFLLESVEGGRRIGRYSFAGCQPLVLMVTRGGHTGIRRDGGADSNFDDSMEQMPAGTPLDHLRKLLAELNVAPAVPLHPAVAAPLPRFPGGAVGYFGYDALRPPSSAFGVPFDDLNLPDALLMVPKVVAILDHVTQKLYLVALVETGSDPARAYNEAVIRLGECKRRVEGPLPKIPAAADAAPPAMVKANLTPPQYMAAVEKALKYIAAGDVNQVVLSRRLTAAVKQPPLQVYRALRAYNPSPYMFYLRFQGLHLIGASPEMLVRVESGVAETMPIAGTAPRGSTPAVDAANAAGLLASAKEQAEHRMLVTLGLEDLGRVCVSGSVAVAELMKVERFSHVMHLVSHLKGRLRPECDALSALAACFPAGTLTGAPRRRAMEIIDELEPTRRGPYGGCVGYIGFNGNMDTCITIRTVIMQGGRAHLQTGAGIVAASHPEPEFVETLAKAGGLLAALELLEENCR